MNRDDLLKRCVDRGVADETSVGAVSHLFYVYLLSALQKGQRVEVPNFGTFGTRVVGVKKARKMPFFEAERDLAEKVNERYKNLKYLVVGRYELLPTYGEEEYRGKDAPYDPLVDQVGKEMMIDTHRDVTIDEYERQSASLKNSGPSKEKKQMPKLNLKEEGMEEGSGMETSTTPPPTLRDSSGGRGPSAILQVLLALVIIGALTFALNYFGVIHLWGKKPAPTVQPSTVLPEPEPTPPVVAEKQPEPTPVPVEAPKVVSSPSSSGNFTVQVSAWITMAKARAEMQKFTAAGFDAFVETATVNGGEWHRVRVGHYPTSREAAAAAKQLEGMLDDGMWITKVNRM